MGIYNGLRALLLLSLLQVAHPKITFPSDSEDKSEQYVRSMEFTDASETDIFSSLDPDRILKEGGRWDDWENDEDDTKNRKWTHPPDEKTISFQVLDEDPYHHGRPAWPHDEYIVGLGHFDLNRPYLNRNNVTGESENTEDNNSVNLPPTTEELTKFYEWKKLQPRPSPSAFIGPGFYDVGSSSNYHDSPAVSAPDYYNYQYQPNYQAITNEGTGKIQSTSPANTESVPGTPSESNTNTRHFAPYLPQDLYKRKRLRLQIHPGLIAAPLAGLAAFGAASALTSKPLLVELGYVRNKPQLGAGGGGGWGLAGSLGNGGYRPYPHFYPPPNPPPHIYPPIGIGSAALGPHHAHGHGHSSIGGLGGGLGGLGGGLGGNPLYPILRPNRARPDSQRSSWWNPFSSLTPRLVIE